LLDGNLFLAVYIGGMTISSVDARLRDKFMPHGGLFSDLFKYATVLLLASLIHVRLFHSPFSWYVFVFVVLFLARPVSMLIALWRSGMNRRERIASEWFGPKGFATILYALFILTSGVPGANQLFNAIALVVIFSIVLHSSTDAIVAKWFDVDQREKRLAS
jgi:NhaP-type Na+/H+ or K+/H+ antiporter